MITVTSFTDKDGGGSLGVPQVVILEGLGHPDVESPFEVKGVEFGFLTTQARHPLGDRKWWREFDEFLASYLSDGQSRIVADFRRHDASER